MAPGAKGAIVPLRERQVLLIGQEWVISIHTGPLGYW
jgi:hypothetical protein